MSTAGARGAQDRTLRLVLSRWGGRWYGLEACRIRGLEAVADRAVPSLGSLLGLAPAVPPPGRLLRVQTAAGELGLALAEPVIQVELPAAAVRPLPAILAAGLRLPWVRALALCPDLGPAPVVILDFTRHGPFEVQV